MVTDPADVAGSEDDDGDAGDAGDGAPTPTSEPDPTGPLDTTGGSGEPGSSSTGDDTTTATTTAAPGTCGDGVVDPGETCDLGYAHNSDQGECSQSCQQAHCGDGLVWAGTEACDAGPNNNDTAYNGCRSDCTLGPRCLDGVLQAEEECDASAPAIEGAVPCDPDNCRLMARVAFVTETTWPGTLGGLPGADGLCVAAATAAGLDNAASFLAWLGDGAAAPASRFTDGLAAKGYPYARRDGQKLANDLDDLLDNGLQVPLVVTEHGTLLPPSEFPEYAWTGVTIHGEPAADHCEAWISSYFKYFGQVGQISPTSDSEADLFTWKLDAHWTSFKTRPCIAAMHLYCFED